MRSDALVQTGRFRPGDYDVAMAITADGSPAGWTFFTNHAHVLIAVDRDPHLRQRDIAQWVGITEGAVQRILADLQDAGYLRRERVGRRNRYIVDADIPLRHPLEAHHSVKEVLGVINEHP